jgi:hypothetical protein
MDEALETLLASVERTELRSLTWGYVDGSLSYDDIARLYEAESVRDAPSIDAVLDEMLDRALLVRTLQRGQIRFRSRFAETLRLLVRLRQVTPTKPWDAAPDLVSDYRVTTAPRRVPRRTFDTAAAVSAWAAARRWSTGKEATARAYLDATGTLLSRFQVDVGNAVLSADEADAGLVVTAGTGAGKTLAYYLPVAVEVAHLVSSGSFWTKSVSLYPRTELLKDQMSDVFRITRRIPTVAGPGRPIRLGALFEPVALSSDKVANAWLRGRRGHVCPFVRCPDCDGDLTWPDDDVRANREILECAHCGTRIGEQGEIGLTRDSLLKRPPDLLFISAEMVNQRLSHLAYRELLGISNTREHRARYLLLDEIHTYGGTTGAQVGGVIRRYRHALSSPVFVVGLSATLRDATEFLSELTGVPPQLCREITPADADLESLGGQYQVVLKANSSNRTSVLSTTLQTTFLLARMLDSDRSTVSSVGLYGSREFVFLDTLDVTNRLYDDLRDAEGALAGSTRAPLASLRPPLAPGESSHRDAEGQAWEIPERIHGPLGTPLRISRTSSQDAGVDAASDVVVATPSLEVGYNDKRVGAVIQHRAPRDLATFVQRRGRAGRPVRMRPWMVTVLSEFGRDRLAFQLYEQLFDPTLPPRHLPFRNRYVLRVQATLALIDWLGLQSKSTAPMWAALSGPSTYRGHESVRARVLQLLDSLMDGDARTGASLARHLRGALQIDERELSALYWLPPRSLLGEVVPTLRRRLATEWARPDGGLDIHEAWHPLPDFLPRALFQDLLVPEVQVQVPNNGGAEDPDTRVPVGQALREFAPGRVSRRLAVHSPRLSHWVEPRAVIPLVEWMPESEPLGFVEVSGNRFPLYRPWQVVTSEVPFSVAKTSYGALDWQTRVEVDASGATIRLPDRTPVASTFGAFEFFLHSRRQPVTVTRFAVQSHSTITSTKGTSESVRSEFVDADGVPAAVGFVQDVDGFRVRLNVPAGPELTKALSEPASSVWRTAYLRHRVQGDPSLASLANPFELSWLSDAVALAVMNASLRGDPERAVDSVLTDTWGALRSAVDVMHQAGAGPETDELAPEPDGVQQSELASRLTSLLDDRTVLQAIRGHLQAAVAASGSDVAWARSQYVSAAGGVLLAAASALLPNRAGSESLIVDLADDGDVAEVWITETVLGGGGVVEAIAETFASDPWRMVRGLEATIGSSDEELLSRALALAVQFLASDAAVKSIGKRVRDAASHEARVEALRDLSAELTRRGVSVDQSLLVTLNQRVFRPGADARLDPLLHRLHLARSDLAQATRLWPEARLFSLAAASAGQFAAEMRPLVEEWRGGAAVDDRALGASVLATLWPSVEDVRPLSVDYYNPFTGRTIADPEWLRRFSPQYGESVALAQSNWRDELFGRLRDEGSAQLLATADRAADLRNAIHEVVASPIPLGALVVYPALSAVVGSPDGPVARFEVRELG